MPCFRYKIGRICSLLALVPMAWAAPPSSGGGSGGGGSTPVPAPVVVDANGVTVGRLVAQPGYGTSGTAGVLLSYNKDSLVLLLDAHTDPLTGLSLSTGLDWFSFGTVYYATQDCTGAAYIISYPGYGYGQGGTRYTVTTRQNGISVALLGAKVAPQQIAVASYAGRDPRDGGTGCFQVINSINGVPVETTLQLDAIGQPPLYIK